MNKILLSLNILTLAIGAIGQAPVQLQTIFANGGQIKTNGQFTSVSVVGEMAVSGFNGTFSGTIGYLNKEDSLGTVSGLKEYYSKNSFIVYPNPNKGEFTLSFDEQQIESVSLILLNALGEQVYETDFLPLGFGRKQEISVHNISSGIYFLQIYSRGQSSYRKLVVE